MENAKTISYTWFYRGYEKHLKEREKKERREE
jgi:hypothetical protein